MHQLQLYLPHRQGRKKVVNINNRTASFLAQGLLFPFWVVELHILPFDDQDERTKAFLKAKFFDLIMIKIYFDRKYF